MNNALTTHAFLPKLALDFASLFEKQAAPVYRQLGIEFPVVASSTIYTIGRMSSVSLVEVAQELGLPHQLVAQRVKVLLKLALITGQVDEKDKRRTLYVLTDRGKAQLSLLQLYLAGADDIFKSLEAEIGVDLKATLETAIRSFEGQSLLDRFNQRIEGGANG